MAPRTTIDALPEQTVPEDTNYMIIQDTGVTKKMSLLTLKQQSSLALDAHIADTVDAHDATAISSTDSGAGINGVTVQSQLGQLASAVSTNTTTKVTNGGGVATAIRMTQAAYDALGVKDPNTLYVIVG